MVKGEPHHANLFYRQVLSKTDPPTTNIERVARGEACVFCAKRALAFYFADNYPGVSSLGWSIGAFSKRYLGYVVKVKADDDMKARLARRYVEERTEAAERASVPLPVNMPPEVRERTEALRRRITGR